MVHMATLISGLTIVMMISLIALLAGSGRQREPTEEEIRAKNEY